MKKKLTIEASNWQSRDVINLEIKAAMFHMHPDKSPGVIFLMYNI